MGSNGPDEVMVAAVDEAECSDTTVEIKIKTLDSQTYTLRVNKRVPVPELKEQIETVTGVVSGQQRLICRGKVLKDDQLLSAYHVEDGHTLHLVVRQPVPPSESIPDSGDPTGNSGGHPVAHRVLLGSFNIADQGDGGIPDLNRIISAVLGSIGFTNVGSNAEGSDHMEPGLDRVERTLGSGGMADSNQQPLDQPTAGVQFDPLHGAFRIPTTSSPVSLQPPVIPDSLTTLLQYLSNLRHEFTSIAGGSHSSVNSGGEQTTAPRSDVGQVGLPTAASLAEVMLSTRQLLIEQAGERLSQLARQLEVQATVTSSSSRNSIQTSAIRTGISLQNLGALLLELGRTTMTLRMGMSPSEAVVNAGPAVYISTSGPNPIMVQPLQPGAGFGATTMGMMNGGSGLLGGSLGSGLFPRNIDIRIRAGPSSSSSTVNQGEQVGAQQAPAQNGQERTSNAPGSGEAGVRVLPIRTVVAAVPASVSRPTSNPSGSSMGLFYPLLARVQRVAAGQSTDARGAQGSIPDSATNQQTVDIGAGTGNAASTVPETNGGNVVFQLHREGSIQVPNVRRSDAAENNGQPGNTQGGGETTPRLGLNEGIFLSGLLNQIIPFISQTSPPEPNNGSSQVQEDEPRVGTSHSRDDCPQTPPSSKRQKKE